MASAGKENTAPVASADTTELEAQLRESHMENELLQAELNSVADTAKTLKKQLECGFVASLARSSSASAHPSRSTDDEAATRLVCCSPERCCDPST